MDNPNQNVPMPSVDSAVLKAPFRKFNKKLVITAVALAVGLAIGGYFFLKNKGQQTVQPGKVYHVGVLDGFSFFSATTDGFKAGMAKLGYLEGKNIVYDIQKSEIDNEQYDSILNKFVANKVDFILTFPTEASVEAKKVTKISGVPVVFTNANVEGVDLINSIVKPGNNLTGVRYPGPDLTVKRFEILLEIAPWVKRIAVPYLRGYPNVPPQLEALHKVISSSYLGVSIVELPVSAPPELQTALEAANKSAKLDAILVMAEPVSSIPAFIGVYGKFGNDHRIPWGGTTTLIKDGFPVESLFGISTDAFVVGEQAAPLADKILKGVPAGTIPVLSAEGVLEVNPKAVENIGITMSEELLSRANKINR